MPHKSNFEQTIRARRDDIRRWLANEAPYLSEDQKHLDANTPERGYWHLGYQSALDDMLNLMNKIMAGERELTTGLLAKDASFRLIVTGKIGAKEIDRLIAKLQLDKEILAESDDDETASQPN